MKLVVGVMLATFGIFWGSEDVGVEWPGSDGAIVAILAFVPVVSLGAVQVLRRTRRAVQTEQAAVVVGAAK